MSSLFTADFFINNRRNLQSLMPEQELIVLTANGLLQRNGDTTFSFRQDSNFWYLTGLDEPDLLLVMDGPKEYLLVPERQDSREVFDGKLDTGVMQKRSGIATILPAVAGWERLAKRLKTVKQVGTLVPPPAYIESLGMYTNPARQQLVAVMKDHNPAIKFHDTRPHLAQLRMVKQKVELSAMQRAIDITIDAFQGIAQSENTFHHEYEVEAYITGYFHARQATHAYQPIVAAGSNACTLHYVLNRGNIREGDLLLLDAGAEVENYAADITRTFAVKQPNKRQRQVLEAVADVHGYARSLLKPGVLIREYEQQVSMYMGQQLRALGLIKSGAPEEIRRFYPHATSHFLGLDVHDIADYDRPLEPGMVLTVEPGIYITAESIGVRLEDNVVITATSHKVLSKRLPATWG